MSPEELLADQRARQSQLQRLRQQQAAMETIDWSDCENAMDRLRRATRDAADKAPEVRSAKEEYEQ
jgi:hypothetical protein